MAQGAHSSVKNLEALALLIALACPCLAGPPSSDGTRDDLPTRPIEVEARAHEGPLTRLRDVRLHLPRLGDLDSDRDSFLRDVSLTELPPGSLVIEYEGLQSFIVRRLQSRYRSLWRSQVSLLYDETSMSDAEYRAANDEISLAFTDLKTGRWWERSWRDSLLPEKGGAPAVPYIHKVGQEIELFRFGGLHLTNELKVRVDRLAVFSLDADPGLVYRERRALGEESRAARDNARLQRAMIDPDDDGARRPTTSRSPVGRAPVAEPLVAIELAPARTIFWEGISWRVKLRPQLRLRLPDDMQPVGFVRAASLRLGIDMHMGQDERQVMSLDFGVSYQPEDGELQVRGELALVSW